MKFKILLSIIALAVCGSVTGGATAFAGATPLTREAILAEMPDKLAGLKLYRPGSRSRLYLNTETDAISSIMVSTDLLVDLPETIFQAATAVEENIPASQTTNFRALKSTKYPNGSGWYVQYSDGFDDSCEDFSQRWLFDVAGIRIDADACAANKQEAILQRTEIEKSIFGKVKLSRWVAKDAK
jgi:hypothetical protein